MKTNYYIGLLPALLFYGISVKAQYADNIYHGNAGAGIAVNNYYANNDYYYSSRINRFHRSYSTFTYYSPVFTETYWYTYDPFSRGISIYSIGNRFSPWYSIGYPVFSLSSFSYDYGRYDPFYYSYSFGGYPSWYYKSWDYDPRAYNYWYTPYNAGIYFTYNLSTPYRGWNNHYCAEYYYRCNDCRPVYYSVNSGHTDERSTDQKAEKENLVSGAHRQASGINSRPSVPISGTVRTSTQNPTSVPKAENKHSGNPTQYYQDNNRRNISESVNGNSSAGIKTETRRSSSHAISRSPVMNQSSVKREVHDYRNLNPGMVAMANPSFNGNSQPYNERRTQGKSNTDNQSRDITGQSIPALSSVRENSVLRTRSSVARDPEDQADEVSGTRVNGRRK